MGCAWTEINHDDESEVEMRHDMAKEAQASEAGAY